MERDRPADVLALRSISRDGPGPANVLGCFADEPPLTLGQLQFQDAVSPDGLFIVLSDESGHATIGSTRSAERHTLPGDGPVGNFRWSERGHRLFYFAREVPMIAAADGSDAEPYYTPIAPAPAGPSVAEWSHDGTLVAIRVGNHAGILDPGSIHFVRLSDEVSTGGFAFDGDGTRVAFMEADSAGTHVRIANTDGSGSITTKTIPAGAPNGLLYWSVDSRWLFVNGLPAVIDSQTATVVDTGTGEGVWSPTAPEIALMKGVGDGTTLDDALHVYVPATGEDRVLVDSMRFSVPRWSPDGASIGFEEWGRSVVVARADGTQIAVLPGIAPPNFGKNGWVGSYWESIVTVQPPSPTVHKLSGVQATWLRDGRLARIDGKALHISQPDGSADGVACAADGLLRPWSEF